MHALAHVILPVSDQSPADAIASSLARFRQDQPSKLEPAWLQFEDLTATARELHETECSLALGSRLSATGGPSWLLDYRAVSSEMRRRGLNAWTVRFADIEPDLDEFIGRFTRGLVRDPATGGWGRWGNPVGVWDWWELGGCFNGEITGNGSHAEPGRSPVSYDRSVGRDVLDEVAAILTGRSGGGITRPMVDVRTDDNVEIVSKLIEDLRDGLMESRPSVVVLPPGSVEDELRWVARWPIVGPKQETAAREALEALGLEAEADWLRTIEFIYERFADHWAAGISFHS